MADEVESRIIRGLPELEVESECFEWFSGPASLAEIKWWHVSDSPSERLPVMPT